MGYMRHHGILVTCGEERVEKAHRLAVKAAIDSMVFVSPISPVAVNGYKSFAVFPDGSKEGWEPSNDGDAARAIIVKGLRELGVHFVEVQYGDDGGQTIVVSHSDDDRRPDGE